MRSGSNFFGSKFLKGETPVGGCEWNAFSHHPALVPGGGQELSLAGTVTVGWTSGILPTLHILPALVFSCPAVYWDNNLLSCLGPWPRSGSVAGCWHGRPALPQGLHPIVPAGDLVGGHRLGGDPTLRCTAQGGCVPFLHTAPVVPGDSEGPR